MPTFRDRIANLLTRARVGKYDADTIGYDVGAYTTSLGITESGAMGVAAVYACIYRISSTIASLDVGVFQRDSQGTQPATSHPAHALITDQPNEYQTAPEFWETLTSYAVGNGAGHALIERGNNGYATSLTCIEPQHISEVRTPAGRAFKIEKVGIVPEEDVFSIYNLQRKSPIRIHAENIGLAAAAQRYGSHWFNDGQMSGILTTDQPLRKEQMDSVRRSWSQQGRAQTRLVPHGLKYQRVTIAPDEAQFIQTRKFQAEEIARIFGVPPSLIQLESQTTYNNVEQQNIQYSRHTISPWTRKIEREIDRKLIQSRERPNVFSRFDLTSMLRGDMNARKEFYQSMMRMGTMTINEVREREGMNPVSNGDIHFVPVNTISLNQFEAFSAKMSGANELQDVPESDDQQRPEGAGAE